MLDPRSTRPFWGERPLSLMRGTLLSPPTGLSMSLADELLADLEEAAEEEEGGSYGEEEEEPAIEDVQEETQLDLSGDSVKSIAKLWDSKMVSSLQREAAGRGDVCGGSSSES